MLNFLTKIVIISAQKSDKLIKYFNVFNFKFKSYPEIQELKSIYKYFKI